MKVEVQFTDGCPNAAGIVAVLEVASAERPQVTVTMVTVETDLPVPAGFAGSPTVLIDGTSPSPCSVMESAAPVSHQG